MPPVALASDPEPPKIWRVLLYAAAMAGVCAVIYAAGDLVSPESPYANEAGIVSDLLDTDEAVGAALIPDSTVQPAPAAIPQPVLAPVVATLELGAGPVLRPPFEPVTTAVPADSGVSARVDEPTAAAVGPSSGTGKSLPQAHVADSCVPQAAVISGRGPGTARQSVRHVGLTGAAGSLGTNEGSPASAYAEPTFTHLDCGGVRTGTVWSTSLGPPWRQPAHGGRPG